MLPNYYRRSRNRRRYGGTGWIGFSGDGGLPSLPTPATRARFSLVDTFLFNLFSTQGDISYTTSSPLSHLGLACYIHDPVRPNKPGVRLAVAPCRFPLSLSSWRSSRCWQLVGNTASSIHTSIHRWIFFLRKTGGCYAAKQDTSSTQAAQRTACT